MLLFGHIGPTLCAARIAAPQKTPDLRMIVLLVCWAILPDVIDKTLLKMNLAPAPTGRLWAHSALAAAGICLFCFYFFRSSWRVALAYPGHLVLDAMWQRPHTLLWPFLGNTFDTGWPVLPDGLLAQGYLAVMNWNWLHYPYLIILVWTSELAGLYLVWYALRPGVRLPTVEANLRTGAEGLPGGGY